MGKKVLMLLVSFFGFTTLLTVAPLFAADVQFELVDGSIIKGAIASFKEGVYEVQTTTLGKITIPASDIKLIRYEDHPSPSSAPPQNVSAELQEQIDIISGVLTSDPTNVTSIMDLHNDADFQAVLQDESIMRAVQMLDLETLMSSQKFRNLMTKEEVKKLLQNVQ